MNVKLKHEGNQVGSVTAQFKFAAPDGKSKSKAYALFDSSFMEPDLTDIFSVFLSPFDRVLQKKV